MMHLLLLLLVLLVSMPVSGKRGLKCPLSLEHQDGNSPWSFYRPGDHLVGIFTTVYTMLQTSWLFNMAPSIQPDSRKSIGFLNGLQLIVAIQMVNKNSQLLHNLTLGYDIHDNYESPLRTSNALLDILSTGEANVPNYSCGRKENLLALLDRATRDISIQISTLADLYKVPQISYETSSEALSDKSQFPFFNELLPKKGFQYPAIVQLLLHFRWTLIGLFASDTGNGENFMRIFTPMLVRNGICVVISQKFSTTGPTAALREALSKWRQVHVFVHFMEFDSIEDRILPFHLTFEDLSGPSEGKVWILTNFSQFELRNHKLLKYIHSIWSFGYLAKERPVGDAFEPYFFVDNQFRNHSFRCFLHKRICSVKGRKRCTQKAPVETQRKRNRIQMRNDPHSYNIIQTLAQALNAAYSSRKRRRRKEGEERLGSPRLQPWQVWGPNRGPLILIPLERSRVGWVF
uniref:Receptor ligand binding region domain-containing protein n=1 Tax=Naja naja TaxID=35670 RepID=A0A8C6XUV5_NAJNA